jgi:hypothetical protein
MTGLWQKQVVADSLPAWLIGHRMCRQTTLGSRRREKTKEENEKKKGKEKNI